MLVFGRVMTPYDLTHIDYKLSASFVTNFGIGPAPYDSRCKAGAGGWREGVPSMTRSLSENSIRYLGCISQAG